MMHVVFRALPRAVTAVALFDTIVASLEEFTLTVSRGGGLLAALLTDPLDTARGLLTFPALALAAAAPSPATLSAVFVLHSLTSMSVDPGFGARFIPLLLALSLLDVLSGCYRKGQGRFVMHTNALASAPALAAIVLPLVLLPMGVQGYAVSLVESVAAAAGRSPLMGLLAANPLFLVAVASVLGLVAYRVMSSLSEVAVVYVSKPSGKARELLTRADDLDVWFRPPLSSLRGLLLAMVFAPPIYYAVEVAAGHLLTALRYTGPLPPEVFGAGVRLLVLLATTSAVWRAMARAFGGAEPSVGRLLGLSAVALAALYAAGVYRALSAGAPPPDALLRPDLEGAAAAAGAAYVSYLSTLFLILEAVTRLLGAAP